MSETPTSLRQPAADHVAETLRQWILSGRLGEGEHIRQELIARELGVSRLPVREALAVLEAEGLVRREQYKGTIVCEVSPQEAAETYEIRELLEVHLFSLSLPHLDESHLRTAETLVHLSESCDEDDHERWAQLNRDFHRALYEAAGRPLTLQTLEHVFRRTERYFRLQQRMSTSVKRKSAREHLEIVNAIRAGDRARAEHALREHITSNGRDLTTTIANKRSRKP